jgi:hypothetical protein
MEKDPRLRPDSFYMRALETISDGSSNVFERDQSTWQILLFFKIIITLYEMKETILRVDYEFRSSYIVENIEVTIPKISNDLFRFILNKNFLK